MDIDELKLLIRKHALANAVKFKGKTQAGAIISKVIGEQPDLKKYMKSVAFETNEIVSTINALSLDEQQKLLQDEFPEMLIEKQKEERDIFAFLNIKQGEDVVTAFPPGPEKYPHIGHAKACLLNFLLAKRHNGKFILRFEDTNPNLVQSIFYDVLVDNLSWLGVKWDELMYASDNMELFYECAEKCISDGNAYMCFCQDADIKKSRSEGIPCQHRNHTIEENLKFWKEFPSYEEGKAILRLKIDLMHQNTTMRDPTIFRTINTQHARHGTKYKVWPNYDFQNSIMDGYYGVTHRLRSKEFEMRNELQRHIQKVLGLKITNIYEFARFELQGVDTSGRVIRQKIIDGVYTAWDDPRLATLVALRRRGFLPEAIKNFVVATGITKSESTLTWDDLIIQNRRILDKTARRYFMMHDYEKVVIENSPHQNIKLNLHPDNEFGFRELETEKDFILSKDDIKDFKEGELYRLMDCLNFRKNSGILEFDSLEYDNFKGIGKKIMHWLPAYGNIDIEILMDDGSVLTGLAEHSIRHVNPGDIIQFERFGFCRLDTIEKNLNDKSKSVYKFWFTHN